MNSLSFGTNRWSSEERMLIKYVILKNEEFETIRIGPEGAIVRCSARDKKWKCKNQVGAQKSFFTYSEACKVINWYSQQLLYRFRLKIMLVLIYFNNHWDKWTRIYKKSNWSKQKNESEVIIQERKLLKGLI